MTMVKTMMADVKADTQLSLNGYIGKIITMKIYDGYYKDDYRFFPPPSRVGVRLCVRLRVHACVRACVRIQRLLLRETGKRKKGTYC